MTLKSIVTAIAQAVALAFLVAPNSLAQQGGESARAASQTGETARAPARKVGKKLALNSPDSPRIALNSLDPRCVPKPGADSVVIARLQNVVGDVLVGTDTRHAAVEQGQAVQSGERVTTMTKSSVLVRYCDGCDVQLMANQRYEISLGESCCERLALREPTLLPSGDAATAAARRVGRKLALNSLDSQCVPKPGEDSVVIARLQNVVGNVLVSTDTGLTAVEQGQAVQTGARVMTMAKSSVLVRYCDGCDVQLMANQRYEISRGESCCERLALRERTLLPSGDAATAALEASDAAAAALAASDAEVAALAASASTSITAAILAGALPASTPLIGGVGLSGAIAAIRDRVGETVSPN